MTKRHTVLIITLVAVSLVALYTLSGSTPGFTIKPVGEPHKTSQPYQITDDDIAFVEDFDEYLSSAFQKTYTPGASVAIVKEGTIIYQRSFGVKSVHGQDSVDAKTRFRIASVSKGFAAILTGLHVRDSLLHWNSPMADYVDYPLPDSAHKITVNNILSHTSGFPYQAYSTLVEDELPRDTMIRRLFKIRLSRQPGDIHSYQNVAYSIIENILEKVTAKPFNQLMHERIFGPLEMHNASICYDSMVQSDNYALPHGYRHRKFVPTRVDRSYYNVAAAGGINASIEDMAKWLQALLGYRPEIIPPEVLDQVFDPVIPIRVKNPYFGRLERPRKGYYGRGWRIIEYPDDTLVYHGGYANGYKSGVALDRNKKVGICVLTNAPSKFSNLAMSRFYMKYKEHFRVRDDVPQIVSELPEHEDHTGL